MRGKQSCCQKLKANFAPLFPHPPSLGCAGAQVLLCFFHQVHNQTDGQLAPHRILLLLRTELSLGLIAGRLGSGKSEVAGVDSEHSLPSSTAHEQPTAHTC